MSIEYSTNKTVGSFVCNKGPCRTKSKVSRGKGTWFDNIKISVPQVFYLMYAYANKFSYDRTKKEDFTEGEHCLSSATINDWINYCREAVVTYQKHKEALAGKIGGPGKIVQIDESKFGKPKYNKGITKQINNDIVFCSWHNYTNILNLFFLTFRSSS